MEFEKVLVYEKKSKSKSKVDSGDIDFTKKTITFKILDPDSGRVSMELKQPLYKYIVKIYTGYNTKDAVPVYRTLRSTY